MNSPEDVQQEPVLVEETAGDGFPGPDTNANVSSQSKGAIPKKVKPAAQKKSCPLPRQAVKLNNNIETMSTLNAEEAPKLNGISNGLPASYLDDLFEPSCSAIDSFYKFDLSKDDSSSDDNDLLSVSDDGCIYTYKGDQGADFPSSFFTLEIPPNVPEPSPERNHTSSPEMDYLEMDFDPGVNGDADSNSDNEIEEVVAEKVVISEPIVSPPIPTCSSNNEESSSRGESLRLPLPVEIPRVKPRTVFSKKPDWLADKQVRRCVEPMKKREVEREMPWSCTLSQRTKSINFRVSKRTHCTKGELVSPSENVPQIKGASVPTLSNENPGEKCEFEDVMIWTTEEALNKQITQIGPSACGATAVLNVLKSLRFPVPTIEAVKECMKTRLRRNDSPLTDYLLSRSAAGTTHEDIIEGLRKISNGVIYGRFFHMYPERVVNLYSWLGFWMKNGAVPIATLNLQRCLGTVPDAWHHQMICGVDADGVHLTNPVECVDAGLLWPQLCSESVLLVRREDVLSRWNFRTDLPELMRIKDIRWRRINVVGQVANIIHESTRELRPGFTNTTHIRIPAAYSSGITLVTTVNSPAYVLLQESPELPLLDPHEGNSYYAYQ